MTQKKIFTATDENMSAVNEFIHSLLPKNTSFGTENQLDLAVEELYVNIAHYAYAPGTGDVEIECELNDEGGKKGSSKDCRNGLFLLRNAALTNGFNLYLSKENE